MSRIRGKYWVWFADVVLWTFIMSSVIFFTGCQNIAQKADTCVLAGKVVDGETGQSIENIKFRLYKDHPDTEDKRESLTSGKDGVFRTTVKPGSSACFVWMTTLNTDMLLDEEWLRKTGNYSVQIDDIKKDTDIVLKTKLRPSVKLSGKVKDANGQNMAYVSVYLGLDIPLVVTDDSGNFLIVAPADRDFELLIFSGSGKHTLTKVKAGTKQLEVVLQPAYSVKGCAIADDNKPAANLNFRLHPLLNGEIFATSADVTITTQEDGTFVAENLCPGENYVAQWDARENADYESGSAKITPSEGETITLRVKRDNWKMSSCLCASQETKCARLANYCLDNDDRILACDAKDKVVRVISPEDKLLGVWKLDFSPEAIACRDDGTVVVAGRADNDRSFISIVILDKNGEVIRNAKLKGFLPAGIGCSGNDIFVSVRQEKDYSIYRLDSELANPKEIVKGLEGCCGQLDLKAKDGVVYVAANCEFSVIKYDRDGKEIGRFGKEGKEGQMTGDEGFIGCCEPKNVCFDSQGNLYTAEAVHRRVKKFTPDGKYMGLAGMASGDYCVRVTIAVSKDCSKIYMLDAERNIIRLVTTSDKTKK